ncbi:Hachiman antiphage defense system protein HamA [Mucilaginibacter aquariorum]|uniref:DUF1837 domain-containing protein n=1 Tax=Mucilaginibacter aquariorum TaxID=2967225 RepID=A0ABT1T8Y6_9SPHI|nr:Hachiman antiphage defense system protein HamA [Mucilaginibacter aquariorum]MCQ6961082.1 DUF1837 domain-containing protein [Mucilaginibacter aquariorum]
MKKELVDLINDTIILKYELPNSSSGILKTVYSTHNDRCYSAEDKEKIAEIIYNSIVYYSINEFELDGKDLAAMHAGALKNKIKYNPEASDEAKIKYGFFGEVLLYSMLYVLYGAEPLIARGYFYNPLENSETKGYDSYQLVETDGKLELWFGEVKFHAGYQSGVDSVLSNIDKALSDAYLERNLLELHNHKNNFNTQGTQIEAVLKTWEANPLINPAHEVLKYDMTLVYPILILYQMDDSATYDTNIQRIPDYIQKNYVPKPFTLSVDHKIFFMLLPIEKVKVIKETVISWIESKKPLI